MDPPAKEIPDRRVASIEVLDKAQLRQDLYLNAGFVVNNYVLKDDEIILKGSQISYRDEDVAMNRIGRVLASHLPESIKTYRVVIQAMDLPMVETVVNAEQFVRAARYESPEANVKTAYDRVEPVLGDEQWAVERDESGFGYNADVFWIPDLW